MSIKVKDKKMCNWSNYVTDGWAITLDTFTYEQAGYLKSWTLVSVRENLELHGETINDLILQLQNIKASYNLQSAPHSKDILVIYTDNIAKLYAFMHNYGAECDIDHYFQILDNIEFRPCWSDDYQTAAEIAIWAQFMIDTVFIPDKYFYITPNQIPRRRMKLARKAEKNTIAADIYPHTLDAYKMLRKAYFGGILYVPYPKMIITDPIIEVDLKSAYIYCMLILKHCMSASKKVDPINWEYYLDSTTKASFGRYRIKYSSFTNKICCFKNANGDKLQKGLDIVDEFCLTNIDLKLMIKNIDIQDIECIYLYEYDLDYMPKYLRDIVINEYLKKEEVKKTQPDSEAERVQKSIVNGCYGDSCRDWQTKIELDTARKEPNLAPQWGIWITSYCRNLLLSLGNAVDGWVYSATDSIYCLDSEDNRKKIEEFNEQIRKTTREFCEKFGYNFDKLKDLGTFCVKEHIKKFKAFGPNSYMYTKEDGKTILKASGCPKEYRAKLTEQQIEDLYDADYIPAGERCYTFINHDKTECDIDGKHYESDGSMYEIKLTGMTADMMSLIDLKFKN